MLWPIEETLKRIAPHIPEPLVCSKTVGHIQQMASMLPNAMSAYYLECRLGANANQVDFSTCTTMLDGRAIMAGEQAMDSISPILLNDPLWSRIHSFYQEWANPTSILYDQMPFVWLEFDNLEAPSLIPVPSLNFCVEPAYLDRHTQLGVSYHPNTKQYQPYFEQMLENLLGHRIPAQTKQNLVDCFEQLPADGQVIYLAVMLPRQPAALKVNALIPKEQLVEYLIQIGWSGSIDTVKQILTTVCSFIDEMRIGLTVGTRVSSRLGIEFFSNTAKRVYGEEERKFLLEKLVEMQLCTPEKQDALMGWSGFSSERFSAQSWPTRLNRSWYVKLVYQADQPLEAKAYLGFAPTFFSLFSLA